MVQHKLCLCCHSRSWEFDCNVETKSSGLQLSKLFGNLIVRLKQNSLELDCQTNGKLLGIWMWYRNEQKLVGSKSCDAKTSKNIWELDCYIETKKKHLGLQLWCQNKKKKTFWNSIVISKLKNNLWKFDCDIETSKTHYRLQLCEPLWETEAECTLISNFNYKKNTLFKNYNCETEGYDLERSMLTIVFEWRLRKMNSDAKNCLRMTLT